MVLIHECLGTRLRSFEAITFDLSRRELPFPRLIHRSVSPKTSPSLDQPCGNEEPLNILWSRDGNFDNRRGVWFEPNHFVPVISEEEVVQWPVKRANTAGTGCKTKQQGTLFSFKTTKPEARADNTDPTKGSSVPSQKRNAVTAKLGKDVQPTSKKSTASIVHKVQYKWKDEFPWLTVREEDQALLCSLCCNAPEVAGKSQFLAGCASTKKETMQKHAASNGHIRAQAAVLAKQKPIRETAIAQSLAKGRKDQEEKDRKEVAVKMTTAFYLAKEEFPFSKFQGLIELSKKEWPGGNVHLCKQQNLW